MKARKVQVILYVILILVCVGIYLYSVLVNKTDPTAHLYKFVLVVAGCVIGILRGNVSQRRASLSVYEKSFQKDIRDAFSWDEKSRKTLLQALRLYNENKYTKAVKTLMKLKVKCRRPDDYYAVGLFLALCFTDMYCYQEAILEYEQILTRRLETSTICNNLGLIYYKLGKNQEAMNCYEQALELSDEHEYTYSNIANLYFAEKDFESAIFHALKALDINNMFRQAADLLAIIYTLIDDKENADKYFHIAITSGTHPDKLKSAINYYKSELE